MPDQPPAPSDASARTAILLVEDSPGDASLIMAALTRPLGAYEVLWVQSLTEARSALQERGYDCVLVDLGLPDAEGLDVVHQVGALLTDDTTLVVLTGREDEGAALAAFQVGADDYLLKAEMSAGVLHRSIKYAMERSKLRSALQRTEQASRALSAIVESTADAIFTKDLNGVITTWNGGAERLYGYTAAEIVGQHVRILHPVGRDESEMLTGVVVGGETVRGFETVRRTKAGRFIHVSLTISPLSDGHGIVGASVIAHDITDRVELEAQLLQQAMHDALTGLPNRALLQERLAQALREAERDGAGVAVLFCDIDRLKTINDARGHLVGDRLLVEVARRFQAVTRPGDTVARWGGDEFVVVCKATEESEAEQIAERIRSALRAPIDLYGQLLHASMSVGIAVAPPLPADADTLLRHADAAMYEAKARGRGRSHTSDRRRLERSREELDLVSDFRRALEDDTLEVHYQPVVDITTGEVSGLEALTRWRHDRRGDVGPSVFVRVAENNGLVERLDRWVLQQACAAAKRLSSSGHLPAQAKVGVNLSASTLCDPGLPEMVQDALARAGLAAESLMVEVTETDVLKDAVTAGESLQALRGLGTAVALDDFGTGYSSLSFVRTLPVTHLKIDRSFVENITQDADDLTITASVIDLAHGLGISTIAEGVQTTEQLAKLGALGCRAGQGFLWSPAMPLQEVTEWLDSRRSESTAGPGGSRVFP